MFAQQSISIKVKRQFMIDIELKIVENNPQELALKRTVEAKRKWIN